MRRALEPMPEIKRIRLYVLSKMRVGAWGRDAVLPRVRSRIDSRASVAGAEEQGSRKESRREIGHPIQPRCIWRVGQYRVLGDLDNDDDVGREVGVSCYAGL